MIIVSTDKSKLDVPFIQIFLKDIYWAAGRTIDEVQTTIDASFCFGIYIDEEQIGFARVVTDYVVFAYLMDVFIDEKHRGKGYSSILIEAMMNEPQLQQVKICNITLLFLALLILLFLYESKQVSDLAGENYAASPGWGVAFLTISILLIFSARYYILKDEALVRSADRLR